MPQRPAPNWLKLIAGCVFAYEARAIVRDLTQGARRDSRYPTISVVVGRQRASVRSLTVAVLVGGLFVHLVPETYGLVKALFHK